MFQVCQRKHLLCEFGRAVLKLLSPPHALFLKLVIFPVSKQSKKNYLLQAQQLQERDPWLGLQNWSAQEDLQRLGRIRPHCLGSTQGRSHPRRKQEGHFNANAGNVTSLGDTPKVSLN